MKKLPLVCDTSHYLFETCTHSPVDSHWKLVNCCVKRNVLTWLLIVPMCFTISKGLFCHSIQKYPWCVILLINCLIPAHVVQSGGFKDIIFCSSSLPWAKKLPCKFVNKKIQMVSVIFWRLKLQANHFCVFKVYGESCSVLRHNCPCVVILLLS